MATKDGVKSFLTVTQEGDILTFSLGNGLKVEFNPTKTSEKMQTSLMYHGAGQKVRDRAAGFSKTSDFAGAFRAMQTTVDNLYNDLWDSRGGEGNTADLVTAVAELKKIKLEDAQATIDGLNDEQLAMLKAKPTVKAKLAEIKAKRAMELAKPTKNEDIFDGVLGIE